MSFEKGRDNLNFDYISVTGDRGTVPDRDSTYLRGPGHIK